MINVERTCPRCGHGFIPGKLGELCPTCLFATMMEKDDGNDSDAVAFWEDKASTEKRSRSFFHFEILDELGRGGMGTVYKVRDHTSQRVVALKILQAHLLSESGLVQRFRSEVRAISSLDHRHILPIHEVGEHDGVPFFSMKLASGDSLAQHLAEYIGQPRRIAQLLAKVSRGVQHAHERGILHRDLKPGNILLDETGEPYVCDFGLAKWIEDDRSLTLTSVVLGTPHYIAPEQATGKQDLTIAADIYSLGAIFYELLTGRPPFVGETAFETMRQASINSPAKPSTIVNSTPRDLETICLKALEREPAARYSTAGAFADDLDNWLVGRPIRARPVGAAEQLWRWARRNPLPAGLSAALIFALTVGTTIAAIKINHARLRAVAAEQDAKEKLYASLLAQAHASRLTNVAGHRIEALKAIQQAVAIRPSLELRNEAIAALSLVDLELAKKVKVRENFAQPLAFDTALKTVAVATKESNINIVSLDDERTQKIITGVGQPIRRLIHSGSQYIAARCSDEMVYVWNLRSGKLIHQYPGHPIPLAFTGYSLDCIFSPNESLLAMGSLHGIDIVDVETGKEIANLKTTQPTCIAIAPDGRQIAWINPVEKTVEIRDLVEQTLVIKLSLVSLPTNVGWSSDQKKFAVGCLDFSIQIFDTFDWHMIGSLQGHSQPIDNVSFNHRGNLLASTARDATVRLWDTQTMSELVALPRYGSNASAVAFSLDDQSMTVTDREYGTSIAVFKFVGLNRACTLFASPAEERSLIIASMDYSRDSTLLATASWGIIQIFDAKRGILLATRRNSTPTSTTLRFLPDGKRLVIVSKKTGMSIYEFSYHAGQFDLNASENNENQFPGYYLGSTPYDASAFLCLISPRESKGIIWDSSSRQVVQTLENQPAINDMVISPDRKWIATSYADQAGHNPQIWSFTTATRVTEVPGGRNARLAFSPSGRWLACEGADTQHLLWDTHSWTRGPVLPPEIEEKSASFAFSHDETMVAMSSVDQVYLVSLPFGTHLASFDQIKGYPRVRFSPDGTQLTVQGADNSLVLWNLPELRKQLRELNLDWE